MLFIAATSVAIYVSFNGFLYWQAPFFAVPPRQLALVSGLEIALVAGVCLIATSLAGGRFRHPVKLLVLLTLLATQLVYVSQAYSGYLTSDYLTVLALENRTEIRYIFDPGKLAGLIIFFLLWLSAAVLALRPAPPRMLLPSIALTAMTAVGWWQAQQHQHWESPLRSLVTTVQAASGPARVDNLDAAWADGYPLMQPRLAGDPLKWMPEGSQPNIIIVFAEGLSARLMASYGGPYPDLTPEIDQFADESLRVDRFFNHTAATFRGIQGMLTSGYPYFGGYSRGGWATGDEGTISRLTSIRYRSLSGILQDSGYDTVFMSPHSRHNPLTEMLRAMDFETVYAAQNYVHFLDRPPEEHPDVALAMTDQSFFEMTCEWFNQVDEEPFLLGLYNIGTHAFTESTGAIYGDGSNPALNRIREFDRLWGEFLDCFRASKMADNTVIVFTTDHAMFHEQPVIEAFGDDPGFNRYFVDQIPLLIHAPAWDLPDRWDARNASSTALAPSLLHLLGHFDVCHAFVDESIFLPPEARNDALPISMAALGENLYYIGEWGVTSDRPTPHAAEFQQLSDRVRAYYALERQNRIFNPDEC